MSNVKRTRKIYGIAGAFTVLAFPFLVMLFNDNAYIESSQSLCPFKLITGFPCPGCGITKSLIFIFEGDFFKSIHYHLFGPFTFLFCIVAIVVLSIELLTDKEYFQKVLYSKKVAYFLGTVLAIYHISRIIFFVSTNNLDGILQQSMWK